MVAGGNGLRSAVVADGIGGMPTWDSAEVRRILAGLAAAEPYQPQYQRRQDGYRLNPPIAPAALDELETRWGVTLPEPYRSFVLEVGDGGAGPGPCGLFRIDRSDLGRDYDEAELDRAFFAAPWPHAGPWNDHASVTSQTPDDEEYLDYCSPRWVTGSLNISHQGCGYMIRLVVTGDARGQLWEDARCSDGGLLPLSCDFGVWYMTWLAQTMRSAVPRA